MNMIYRIDIKSENELWNLELEDELKVRSVHVQIQVNK